MFYYQHDLRIIIFCKPSYHQIGTNKFHNKVIRFWSFVFSVMTQKSHILTTKHFELQKWVMSTQNTTRNGRPWSKHVRVHTIIVNIRLTPSSLIPISCVVFFDTAYMG